LLDFAKQQHSQAKMPVIALKAKAASAPNKLQRLPAITLAGSNSNPVIPWYVPSEPVLFSFETISDAMIL